MSTEQQINWYFTFGFGQEHQNRFIKFFGTRSEAREQMVERFGRKWSMQYCENDFMSQIEKYGLSELF